MPASPKMQQWLFPFTHWNWKVAAITAIFRGTVCMLALRHVDIQARQHFGIVEALYVLFTAGFFSALQQQALTVKSRTLAWLVAVILVPLTSLGADTLLHLWLNSVHATTLGMGALIFTLISAMFHWHIMQNGVLLVGKNSNSFVADLKQIPKLILSFLATLPGGRKGEEMRDIAKEPEFELVATEP